MLLGNVYKFIPPTYNTFIVKNSTFKNLLYGASSLAIYFDRNKRAIVENCGFDNIKRGGSGTLYYEGNEVNIMKNCTFSNQEMPYGGTVFITSRNLNPEVKDLHIQVKNVDIRCSIDKKIFPIYQK